MRIPSFDGHLKGWWWLQDASNSPNGKRAAIYRIQHLPRGGVWTLRVAWWHPLPSIWHPLEGLGWFFSRRQRFSVTRIGVINISQQLAQEKKSGQSDRGSLTQVHFGPQRGNVLEGKLDPLLQVNSCWWKSEILQFGQTNHAWRLCKTHVFWWSLSYNFLSFFVMISNFLSFKKWRKRDKYPICFAWLPCDIGERFGPTKWGAKEPQNPQNHRVVELRNFAALFEQPIPFQKSGYYNYLVGLLVYPIILRGFLKHSRWLL